MVRRTKFRNSSGGLHLKKVSWGKGFLRLMIMAALIATLGLVASPASAPVSGGDYSAWNYRQKITIDHNRVGTMSALISDAVSGATSVDVEDYSLFTGGDTVRLVDDENSEELTVKGPTGSNTVTFVPGSKLTYSYTVTNHACLKNVSNPGADLENFPVLVKITGDNPIFGQAQSDGGDILFTASDGTTKLSHEIDYYSDSGTKELDAWVKVDVDTSADTTLYMYYGYSNGSCPNQEDAENVWEEIWTISNCEDITDWTGTSLSTGSGKDGKCVKDMVSSPGEGEEYVTTYDPGGTWDLSNERIDFWLQSDRASTDYTSARLYAYYQTDTKYYYWDLTFDADTWTHIVAKGTVYDGRSTGPAPDLSSIDYISLDFEAADTTGFYKMIDWIRAKSGAVMVQHLQETSVNGTYEVGVTYDDHFDSTSNHNDGDVFSDNVVHGQTVNITAQGEPVYLDFKLINEYPEPVIYTYGEPGAGKWTYTYYDTECTIDCVNGTITANLGGTMTPGKAYLMNYTYLGENTGANMTATGKIAGADFFDGDDDFIDFSKDDTNFDIRDAITVEAWVKVGWRANKGPWEADNPDYGIVSSGTGYEMCLWTDVAGNLTGVAEFIPDGWFQIAGIQYDCCPEMAEKLPLIVHENEWYRIAIVCDGTDIYTYVNSVLDFSMPADVPGLIDGELGDVLFVGISADLFEQVLGTIDEVRVSDVARDAAWIKACYYNQAYPDVFYSLGALEGPLTVAFSDATYSVGEEGGSATITVNLSAASDDTVTVDYATSDGTATEPDDYTAASGTLTFSPSDTSETFAVTIIDDASVESDETVNLSLSNPSSNATLGTPSTAVLTIVDNDGVTPTLMEGDVTLDKHVKVFDAMFVAQWVAGLRTLDADQLKCADTYDDGGVNVFDAMHIAQWVADPTGSLGILTTPLWESPGDDDMLHPVP